MQRQAKNPNRSISQYFLSTRWSHLYRTSCPVSRSNTPSRIRQGRIQKEMVNMLAECQCNDTISPIPAYGAGKVFSVWCYLGRCSWRNTGCAIPGREELASLGLTENLLNKKLSVFLHSWRPIIAIQLEKLEAERTETLWFDPNSLHYSWCVQNASGFCEVQDTVYLSASAIFWALHWAECSNPGRWHWEANPLGHPRCQIL